MKELRTFTLQLSEKICTNGLYEDARKYIFTCKQFENLLLILTKENYKRFKEGEDTKDFNYLTDAFLMQNVLFDYKGKKEKEKEYILKKYSKYQIFQDLLKKAKEIGHNNVPSLIKRVKNTYKSYFELVKMYREKQIKEMPELPQPKKLSKLKNYAIDLNNQASVSFRKFNDIVLGVNLNTGMKYVIVNPEIIAGLNLTKDKLQSAKLTYSNGYLYLQMGYYKEIKEVNPAVRKNASIDIGLKNTVSCFVDDKNTPSFIVSGGNLQSYNNRFNKELSDLQTELTTKEVNGWGISKTGTKYPKAYTKRGLEIKEQISKMFEERNKFFGDQFHKIAKYVLEYLHNQGITDLYISKNLAELKNNGNCNLRLDTKRNFIQIPFLSYQKSWRFLTIPKMLEAFLRLFKIFEYKAKEYEITLHYVDEAYTSKTSCITADISQVQLSHTPLYSVPLNWVEGERGDINKYNGKRTKRGLFKDTILNKIWNADLNGAVNILKVGVKKSFEWLEKFIWKLCNPIKVSVSKLYKLITYAIAPAGLRYRTQKYNQ